MNKADERWLRAFATELRGSGLDMRARQVEERFFKPTRRRPSSTRAPGKSKEERRQEKWARTNNVRVEVFKRDGYACVVCGAEADDMHHMLYGSGVRNALESAKTCASVCRFHHDTAHAGDISTLMALAMWAEKAGFGFAENATLRRIEKIKAVRNGRAA